MFVIAPERHPVLAACRLFLRAARAMAPRSERRTWAREWEAELEHLWRRGTRDGRPDARVAAQMIVRSAGAIAHALWLRGQEWRPDMLMQDLRFAIRSLGRRPLFTLVIVLTIALGIGANAGIFSVLYDVVLEPLPFEDPEELVMVWEHNVPRDNRTNVVAPANFFVWRDDTEVFEELAGVTWFSQALTGTEDMKPSRPSR
jgi:putative ABC transport system permease protein